MLALLQAKFRPGLTVNEVSIITFRVWVSDIDSSIMNHAAMMTVMEAGRIDLMVRSGFFKLARKEKWYFPTSAISVQFYRPLKALQKANLSTQVIHVTPTDIYLQQKIMRNEKEIARCIVKSRVKKRKGIARYSHHHQTIRRRAAAHS